MIIKLSRHAKRRAKLYHISESTISGIIEGQELSAGVHEIIKDVSGFKYPIKIVVKVENNIVTVITSYPLKKGRKK